MYYLKLIYFNFERNSLPTRYLCEVFKILCGTYSETLKHLDLHSETLTLYGCML